MYNFITQVHIKKFMSKLPISKITEALYKIIVALSTLILVHQEVKDLAIALDIEKALKNIPKGRMSRLDEIVAESLVLL